MLDDGCAPMPDCFNPLILRTVFIDAELFNDDRELRKLVRDPLRSTSFVDIVPMVSEPIVRRNELVRFGMILDRECGIELDIDDDVVLAARNDRLRSKLCRLRSINDFTTDLDFDCVGLVAVAWVCECSAASLHDDVLSLPSVDTKL